MILRVENQNGFSAEIGGKSGLKLLDYPDFGNVKTEIISEKIPGIRGELIQSVELGSRDIRLKVEAGLPMSEISRIFAEGIGVTITVDGLWQINGIVNGVAFSRPARASYPVMNLIIRCPDPYFKKLGAKVSVSFSNNGGGIYQTGSYTYTRFVLHNEGDAPCPVNIQMANNYSSQTAVSGLMTYIDWNSGKPLYEGVVFKKGTEKNVEHFITTDISSDRFFESWDVMDNTDYFLLPPGDTELYAQNVKGTISFEPLFLFIDGRDM